MPNDDMKRIDDFVTMAPIFSLMEITHTKCKKCGELTKNEMSYNGAVKQLIKNIELMKVWVRRFGKISSAFVLNFKDRAQYDQDIKELYDVCIKSLDKMYLESEILEPTDDGDIKIKIGE